MIVSLKEIKEYLRVDFEDEDALLEGLLQTAQQLCMDVARMADEASFSQDMVQAKTAVLYAAATCPVGAYSSPRRRKERPCLSATQ